MSERQPCPCEPCPNEGCMGNGYVKCRPCDSRAVQKYSERPDGEGYPVGWFWGKPCPTCQGTARVRPEITPERLEEIRDDAGHQPCPNPKCKYGRVKRWTDYSGQRVVERRTCPTCKGKGRVVPDVGETEPGGRTSKSKTSSPVSPITAERLAEIGEDALCDLTELANAGGKHLALTGQSDKLLDWLWAVVDRQNEILGNIDPPPITDEMVEAAAMAGHAEYERMSPGLGYTTRAETAVPWEDLPANNKALMLLSTRAALEAARDLEEGT